jgi:hypothetical protein
VLKAFKAAGFLVVFPLTTEGLVVGQVQEQAVGDLVVLIGLPVVVAAGFSVVATAGSVGSWRKRLFAATGELSTNKATSLSCKSFTLSLNYTLNNSTNQNLKFDKFIYYDLRYLLLV